MSSSIIIPVRIEEGAQEAAKRIITIVRDDPVNPPPDEVQALTWAFKGLYGEVYPGILESMRQAGISTEGQSRITRTTVIVCWNAIVETLWPEKKFQITEG